jgi:hypothetical protein
MKKLACRLGRHDWTTRVEGGERYKVCAACGKTPPDPPKPGPEHEETDWERHMKHVDRFGHPGGGGE